MVVKLSCFFLLLQAVGGLKLFFLHINKNQCNFLMCSLKFGTNKEQMKVNSGTEFGINFDKHPMCKER